MGIRLREGLGFMRAATAVARKLPVIMHAKLKSGERFERLTMAAVSLLGHELPTRLQYSVVHTDGPKHTCRAWSRYFRLSRRSGSPASEQPA